VYRHFACLFGDPEIGRELIRYGADITLPTKERHESCLHLAAGAGCVEMLQMLLESGAPVDCRNSWGWTPLHSACANDVPDGVELLLDHGANASLTAKPWSNPLLKLLKGIPGVNPNPCQLAYKCGNYECVEVFKKRGLCATDLVLPVRKEEGATLVG